MTQNQIAYWNLKETTRHNLATEAQASDVLAESKRHSLATEAVASFSAKEQARSNRAHESIAWFQSQETQRHNIAAESEQKRSNLAREAEQYRSNTAQEAISWAQYAEGQRHNRASEALNAIDVDTRARKAAADIELGVNTLAETHRANSARESETWRHNQETERYLGYTTKADTKLKDAQAALTSANAKNASMQQQLIQQQIDAEYGTAQAQQLWSNVSLNQQYASSSAFKQQTDSARIISDLLIAGAKLSK